MHEFYWKNTFLYYKFAYLIYILLFHRFINNELLTTDNEENAIAVAAIIGFNRNG